MGPWSSFVLTDFFVKCIPLYTYHYVYYFDSCLTVMQLFFYVRRLQCSYSGLVFLILPFNFFLSEYTLLFYEHNRFFCGAIVAISIFLTWSNNRSVIKTINNKLHEYTGSHSPFILYIQSLDAWQDISEWPQKDLVWSEAWPKKWPLIYSANLRTDVSRNLWIFDKITFCQISISAASQIGAYSVLSSVGNRSLLRYRGH